VYWADLLLCLIHVDCKPNLMDDTETEVVVDIQREDGPKPFIGGFRHRKTGIEYHHAFTQTWVPKEPKVRQ
jgi:hypothetical protein